MSKCPECGVNKETLKKENERLIRKQAELNNLLMEYFGCIYRARYWIGMSKYESDLGELDEILSVDKEGPSLEEIYETLKDVFEDNVIEDNSPKQDKQDNSPTDSKQCRFCNSNQAFITNNDRWQIYDCGSIVEIKTGDLLKQSSACRALTAQKRANRSTLRYY